MQHKQHTSAFRMECKWLVWMYYINAGRNCDEIYYYSKFKVSKIFYKEMNAFFPQELTKSPYKDMYNLRQIYIYICIKNSYFKL